MTDPQRAFRDALGSFPTGVTVVTASPANGERLGLTVSSFNSVSLDPPLILFSVARDAASLGRLLGAGAYAVNVLGDDQTELSNRFADTRGDPWSAVRCRAGVTGAPILEPALASFECEPYGQHDGGDHAILVGRVVAFESSNRGRPLVFFRGQYHQLRRIAPTPSWVDASLHGW